MLTHRQIVLQVLFVNTTKRSQEITRRRPQPFNRIRMHFAHTIAVIISRPLVLAVTDRSVRPLDLIVALPFIGITSGLWLGVVMYMLVQGLAIRMLANAQAALPTLSANRANHWWSVIFIAAMTSSLVGSTSRRVKRIAVLFAFFPPRSETSRLAQYDKGIRLNALAPAMDTKA